MSSTTRDADQRLSHDSDAARTRWPQDDVEADAVPGSKTRVGGIHLIVLVHGLFGSQANLQSAKEEIVKAAEEQEQREMTTRRDDGRSSKSGGDKEEGTRVIGGNGLVQDESSDGNRGATNTLGNGKPLSAGSSSTSTTTTTDTEPTQAADANTQPAPASSSLSSPLLTTRVLVPTSFPGSMTYDGLEVLAGRVAGEIDAEIERISSEDGLQVVAFSIMGYSLGGLIARYLVGLLASRSPSFFTAIKPLHFSTIATPHLGIPRYGSLMSRITHSLGGWLFSRSGAELFLADKVDGDARGRPLLEAMADPGSPFVKALQSFRSVLIVANGCHDLTVPYPSAAIASFDPFMDYEHTGVQVDVDEEHDPHVVRGWNVGVDAEQLESKVGELARRQGVSTTKRAKLPPFLQFRWPFNYLFYAVLPVLAPLWFGFLTVLMTWQTFQSSRRRRQHRLQRQQIAEAIPLLVDSDTALNEEVAAGDDSSSSTPAMLDPAFGGSTTPSVTPKVPLLLSASQQRIVSNLNAALPHAKRLVAWFPAAYNSHAVIVVRDPKRFPSHEQGRGVLRRWAREVVAAGAEQASG